MPYLKYLQTLLQKILLSDDLETWDSLRHLNLILALEEEFEITIPDEEVGDLVNFKLIELVVNEQK